MPRTGRGDHGRKEEAKKQNFFNCVFIWSCIMYIYVLGHQQMAMSSQALYICLKRTINIDTLSKNLAFTFRNFETHIGVSQGVHMIKICGSFVFVC